MRKLLLPAATLAAILAAPMAYAADDNNPPKHERANDNSGGDNQDRGDRGNGPAAQRPGAGDNGPGNRDMNDNRVRDNDNDRAHDNDNNSNNDRARDNDNNKARDRNDTNVRVRVDNNGPDKVVVKKKTVDRSVVLKVRGNITAPHRYRATKVYVRPTGWYAHRWTYGERLPRVFFAPDYFILDFAAYGLISPWDGYEWVRYGDDALLIDVETGEVIRVEYGLFY